MFASRFDTSCMVLCARVPHSKEGPSEGRGEGGDRERDVSLSGSHFKRLERTPSYDEDESYPLYETLRTHEFQITSSKRSQAIAAGRCTYCPLSDLGIRSARF